MVNDLIRNEEFFFACVSIIWNTLVNGRKMVDLEDWLERQY